eukprot:3687426-Amphidinium_carterae.1
MGKGFKDPVTMTESHWSSAEPVCQLLGHIGQHTALRDEGVLNSIQPYVVVLDCSQSHMSKEFKG